MNPLQLTARKTSSMMSFTSWDYILGDALLQVIHMTVLYWKQDKKHEQILFENLFDESLNLKQSSLSRSV